MHQPVREGLEEYLAGRLPSGEFESHLQSCAECSVEVEILREQSRLVRVLRADETVEPAPGFYARVLNRIEQHVRPSIWALLLEPSLGRRIAMASAVLTVAIGAYIVSTEPFRPARMNPTAIYAIQALPQQDTPAVEAQDRDLVLANLASFQDN